MGNHSYNPPPPYLPPPAEKGGKATLWVLFLVGVGVGAAVGSCSTFQVMKQGAATAVMPQATVTTRSTATVTASPRPQKTPKPSPSPSPVSVSDGTWVVGEDIPAGTYKTGATVDGDCYWSINKSGTNGQTIIQNAFPGGGRPVVNLRRGQDFHSARCGVWVKR